MSEIEKALLDKYNELKEYIKSLEKVAVAYSSGVDSTFLLYAAKEAVGENAIAVTSCSASFPNREKVEANDFCKEYGIRQLVFESNELENEEYVKNPPNRCYICKKALFTGMLKLAEENGFCHMLEGSNLDDDGDYRPGMQAIAELQVKRPLKKIGFTKQEIRLLSRYLGLPTWSKASFACLASRFPYGEEITSTKLRMVEQAEDYLMSFGFKQFRVRIHGENLARIELLPEDFSRLWDEKIRSEIYGEFSKIGFAYTALDLKGYRTGSMNEIL